MSRLIYIDTNVYLDLFEDRKDKFRSFGEVSRQLFRRALDCEFRFVISPIVLREIKDNNYEKDFFFLLDDLKKADKILRTYFSYSDKAYASQLKILRKTPFQDTCHAVIAARMKVEYLVTRNVKDYYNLSDIVTVISPDYL